MSDDYERKNCRFFFHQATEQPLDNQDLSTYRSHPGSGLVAPSGGEKVEVVLHAATGLQTLEEGKMPTAFCTL